MSIEVLFWIIMIVWIIFGVARGRGGPPWTTWGGDLVLFVLLFLLGWAIFGFVIHR